MSHTLAYKDAVDLLDADHKLVQKLFLDYQAMSSDGAPPEAKQALAQEIFYPAVRAAIEDDPLMDEALLEHAQAKELIARIQGMSPGDAAIDDTVQELFTAIMDHVMEEREQIFLKARYSTADLRGMVPALYARKKELQTGESAPAPAGKKKVTS
jgi:hypothetical protein